MHEKMASNLWGAWPTGHPLYSYATDAVLRMVKVNYMTQQVEFREGRAVLYEHVFI